MFFNVMVFPDLWLVCEGIYHNTLMFVVHLCVSMYLYNEGLKYVSVCISGTAGALADKSRGHLASVEPQSIRIDPNPGTWLRYS